MLACSSLVTFACLVDIFLDVLLLEFAHSLDLVEVDDEACVVGVMQSDALAAKDGQMIRAVEVLHSLGMLSAELLLESSISVFFLSCTAGLFKVEVGLGEDGIFLHDLVKDVDIQGETLRALQLLDEFAANRASHAVVVVQGLDARGAQSVATVDQDARDALSYIVAEAAKLANVKAARTVVQVEDLMGAGALHIFLSLSYIIFNYFTNYLKFYTFIPLMILIIFIL
jgi:hypothetical protein